MFEETVYCYEFDEYRLYPGERLLLSKDARVKLRGKDFDVLVYLVKRQKRLVTHRELLSEVWEGAFIEEGNITTSISKIRKALGDNSRSPKYIESIKGFGYRFLVEAKSVSHLETNQSILTACI